MITKTVCVCDSKTEREEREWKKGRGQESVGFLLALPSRFCLNSPPAMRPRDRVWLAVALAVAAAVSAGAWV